MILGYWPSPENGRLRNIYRPTWNIARYGYYFPAALSYREIQPPLFDKPSVVAVSFTAASETAVIFSINPEVLQ